ncbi:hypothetical protein [Roseimaritima sediminicola]|uniref:hypothetical protein n=1 Tax=Roseimaritima sediminicola TaxID=2662066 RepID=UPI001298277E|nr:hypothetical protein [Roseimaritima sediminicola]
MTVGSSTGCSVFQGLNQSLSSCDCVDEFMIGYRNRALAAQAWHARKHCYNHHGHQDHFSAGFIQGYIDVADGGDGCTPAIAPRDYWGWRYQSPEGQAKVAAWFAGYPMGAKAAEEDGLGHWSQLPTMYQAPLPVPLEMAEGTLPPATTPPVELTPPPEGVPVRVAPMGDGLAPTPVLPPHSALQPQGMLDGPVIDGQNSQPPAAPEPEGVSAAAPNMLFAPTR